MRWLSSVPPHAVDDEIGDGVEAAAIAAVARRAYHGGTHGHLLVGGGFGTIEHFPPHRLLFATMKINEVAKYD